MLLQAVFYILMLFAMAALTIDLGLLRLTQVQMQNAADTAALEGLRGRDALNCDPTDPNYASCLATEETQRRDGANSFVTQTFLEDPVNPTGTVGAGPAVSFAPGQYDPNGLNAAQCFNPTTNQLWDCGGPALPASSAYRPDPSQPTKFELQKNFTSGVPDKQHGDMVSGRYLVNTSASYQAAHGENDNYDRTGDFTPGDTSKQSFLVRLRRTIDPTGNCPGSEKDNEAGISSSGPRVPLLFGRGTFIQRIQKASGDCFPHAAGLPVHATAIADAKPVLRVGSPATIRDAVGNLVPAPSATPFALTLAGWSRLIDLQAGVPGTCVFLDPLAVSPDGHWIVPKLYSVAQSIASSAAPTVLSGIGYVPIYGVFGGLERVVGFGYVEFAPPGFTCSGSLQVAAIRQYVAPRNASVSVGSFPPDALADLPAILQANSALTQSGGLLAPALVR